MKSKQMCNRKRSKRTTLLSEIKRQFSTMSLVEQDCHLPLNLHKLIKVLWTAINDPAMQQFIAWHTDDKSFIIHENNFETNFIREKYSKNCSCTSFYRQMNMFGFQKRSEAEGPLEFFMQLPNPPESTTRKHWFHPYFQRGRPDLLEKVVKKKSTPNVNIRSNNKNILPLLPVKRIQLPKFLQALWNAINDPKMQHLISWNLTGDSVITKMMGPQFHKKFVSEKISRKCSLESFCRQMNVYGFQKCMNISTQLPDHFEPDMRQIYWYNPFFQKDRPDLVWKIQRTNEIKTLQVNQSISANIKHNIKRIHRKQRGTNLKLLTMRRGNAAVWTELARLKLQQSKQHQMICKTAKLLNVLLESPILPSLVAGSFPGNVVFGAYGLGTYTPIYPQYKHIGTCPIIKDKPHHQCDCHLKKIN